MKQGHNNNSAGNSPRAAFLRQQIVVAGRVKSEVETFTTSLLISTAVVVFVLGVAYRVASLSSPQLMALLYHDSVIFQLSLRIKIALYISAICAIAIVIFMWYNAQYKEVEA